MIIKNFDELSTTPLRKKALEIIESGYQSILTDHVLTSQIRIGKDSFSIQGTTYSFEDYKNIYLVAYGKSSYAAAKTIDALFGVHITKGIAIGLQGGETFGNIQTIAGTHPAPTQINVEATEQIMHLLEKATEHDLVLTIISGGGSSLLTAPYKIDVATKAQITTDLMNNGASIHELNIVRKHLSRIKGGRFSELAYPAHVVSLIFSDVPGNNLATIASGATVLDTSTMEEAQTVLNTYHTLERLNLSNVALTESPKDATIFKNTTNYLVLDPATAVQAMAATAESLGLTPRILSTKIQGDAKHIGALLLDEVKPGEALIASGETTVTITGNGIGGRNQTLVLANLEKISPKQVIISAASDGHDHSDSGGAIADHDSFHQALAKGLNPEDFVTRSDSYTFFQKTGDFLDTGLLDSNIADMMLVVQSPE